MEEERRDIKEIEAAVLDDARMTISLLEDASHCRHILDEQDNHFWRRTYIRTVFAAIEGSIYNMKKTILMIHEERTARLSKDESEHLKLHSHSFWAEESFLQQSEIALLKEESYELSDKGEAYEQTKFIPLLKNLRFTFKLIARTFSIDYQLKIDDDGWASLRDALEIRNRITHPKSLTDLDISDDELARVRKAEEWYMQCFYNLNQACLAGPLFEGLTDITE